MQLLLIEDDRTIAQELVAAFERQSWTVDCTGDAKSGLLFSESKAYAVIVLDRMLPDCDGIDILRALREKGNRTPVLILSAIGDPSDKAFGLDSGASDYVSKPFSIEEVLARVRALDRQVRNDPQGTLKVGQVEILLNAQKALYNGVHIPLGPAEYRLLRLLAENSGSTVTRRMIMERVFNWRAEEDPSGDRVAVHIRRLREKLERVTDADLIETVRGIGYSFKPQLRS